MCRGWSQQLQGRKIWSALEGWTRQNAILIWLCYCLPELALSRPSLCLCTCQTAIELLIYQSNFDATLATISIDLLILLLTLCACWTLADPPNAKSVHSMWNSNWCLRSILGIKILMMIHKFTRVLLVNCTTSHWHRFDILKGWNAWNVKNNWWLFFPMLMLSTLNYFTCL